MRNDLFLKEIGMKVRAARKAKGLSLHKLSDATGIDLSNLSFIENGKRGVRLLTLKAIADALRVDIKDFL